MQSKIEELPLKMQFLSELSGNFPCCGGAMAFEDKDLPLKLQF